MILVTGGTGFLGNALTRQLVTAGHRVRLLIRPSPTSPNLPRGVPVEVAMTGLGDVRGLRAALRGVDVIYHLAGAEQRGARGSMFDVDIKGTQNLAQAASDARVDRFFYVSHLGADRASAYPVMKAKGIAEEFIRRSGAPHTIFRSAFLYGPGDHFTTDIARLIHLFPIMFIPASNALLQPLWVEDLATCMVWSLDNLKTVNETYEVGGPEFFSFRQVVQAVSVALQKPRLLAPLALPSMRALTVFLEYIFPRFPASVYWLDYLSINRTCAVDSVPRNFGFLPARFTYRLDHLKAVDWFSMLRASLRRREEHA
jgi:NADH dehydrogenase